MHVVSGLRPQVLLGLLLLGLLAQHHDAGDGPTDEGETLQQAGILSVVAVMVGLGGLEPPTSSLSGKRSNRLSYRPLVTFARTVHLSTDTA